MAYCEVDQCQEEGKYRCDVCNDYFCSKHIYKATLKGENVEMCLICVRTTGAE